MITIKEIREASNAINPEWTAAFNRKAKAKVDMRDWMNVTKTYISKRDLGAVPLEGIYPKNAKRSGVRQGKFVMHDVDSKYIVHKKSNATEFITYGDLGKELVVAIIKMNVDPAFNMNAPWNVKVIVPGPKILALKTFNSKWVQKNGGGGYAMVLKWVASYESDIEAAYNNLSVKEASSMTARRAGSKRVHHSELVKDINQIDLLDYMMKNSKFAKAVAKAGFSRKDIYFDDNELVFGDKTVASFKNNDKVSDMMAKVK
jgi:hypothetical protein